MVRNPLPPPLIRERAHSHCFCSRSFGRVSRQSPRLDSATIYTFCQCCFSSRSGSRGSRQSPRLGSATIFTFCQYCFCSRSCDPIVVLVQLHRWKGRIVAPALVPGLRAQGLTSDVVSLWWWRCKVVTFGSSSGSAFAALFCISSPLSIRVKMRFPKAFRHPMDVR